MTADTKAQGDLVALADEYARAYEDKRGIERYIAGVEDDTWTRSKLASATKAFDAARQKLEAFAAALQGRGTQEGEPSDERAAFEAEFRPRYPDPVDWEQAIRRAPGTPNNYELQAAWHAWQARATLAQALKERDHG